VDRVRRGVVLAALLAAACGGTEKVDAAPGGSGGDAGHGGAGGGGGGVELPPPTWEKAEVRSRWRREGFGWANALLAFDHDGDGDDEYVLGGRGVALIDPADPDAHPIWSAGWEDGTEYEWTYGLARFDGNGDGVEDVLVVATGRDAYLLDGRTGARIWHAAEISGLLPARMALVTGDDDGVPDLFVMTQSAVRSGATGEVLYDLHLPAIVDSVAAAELDGAPGVDLLVGLHLDGPIDAPPPEGVQLFGFRGSEKLFEFHTVGGVVAVAGADVDGDGIAEAIAGTNAGWIYVVAADGTLRWSEHLGDGSVIRVTGGDVDGDGKAEVFAAYLAELDGVPTRIQAWTPEGERTWSYGVAPVWVETLRLDQLDDDEALELVVTCGDEVHGLYSGLAVALHTAPDAPAREQWKIDFGLPVLGYEMLERDGKRVMMISAEDARIRAVDPATGTTAWVHYPGDLIAAVAAGDANGDGVADVFRGDQRGNVHLVDGRDGTGLWSRRVRNDNGAYVASVAMGDVDGDGAAEMVVGGVRLAAAQAGVVELYRGDGALLWTKLVAGDPSGTTIADLDGDGRGEILFVEWRSRCVVHAVDAAGNDLWQRPIDTCGPINYLHVADVNGDGRPEIAYAAPPFFEPADIALLAADGTLLWNVMVDDAAWVQAAPGGVFTGGGATMYGGFTGFFAAESGEQLWEHRVEPIPDPENPDGMPLGNPVYFGAAVPDQDGDGVPEVAISALRNTVHLIDGATGEDVWVRELESRDLGWDERPAGGPIVYVPATASAPAWLATAQWAEGYIGTKIRGLRLEDGGTIFESRMEAAATCGAVATFSEDAAGAVFGAGASLYAVEAAARE